MLPVKIWVFEFLTAEQLLASVKLSQNARMKQKTNLE